MYIDLGPYILLLILKCKNLSEIRLKMKDLILAGILSSNNMLLSMEECTLSNAEVISRNNPMQYLLEMIALYMLADRIGKQSELDLDFLNPYCVEGKMFWCSSQCVSLECIILSTILRMQGESEIGRNLFGVVLGSKMIRNFFHSFGKDFSVNSSFRVVRRILRNSSGNLFMIV